MDNNKFERQELIEKLNLLLKKQSEFQQEIRELENKVVSLLTNTPEPKAEKIIKEETLIQPSNTVETPQKVHPLLIDQKTIPKKPFIVEKKKSELSIETEKFIGENLISKIGIGVLIIGVGIGVKYAIDNNLISPLLRIILGYLVGFALSFFAIRLKKNYYNFSAVLFSGAMAIHYFITYAAFSYYKLYPQSVTFILMVLITVLTVWLALFYNRQVIAHFGLVGAYIIPFLLKDPSSSVLVLLVYMAIINLGILYISTQKRWKPLNYIAFVATWIIFITWFASKSYDNQLRISLTFLTLFFAIFYMVFLSYKLILKEKFKIDDIIFFLLNSAMFYTLGMIALDMSNLSLNYSGLFTFINALIHSCTAYLIYCSEKKDKNLFYWTLGIAIAFFTVTIPIQFNNYITAILWSVEAFILFWYGRTKNSRLCEIASYIVVFLLFIIEANNWTSVSYNFYLKEINTLFTPVFNLEFLSSFVLISSIVGIFYIQQKNKTSDEESFSLRKINNIVIPVLLIVLVYFTFFTEISLFWNNIQVNTSFEQNSNGIWIKQFDKLNPDVFYFKKIWLLNYSFLFASILGYINFRWFKNFHFNVAILLVSSMFILSFLSGLASLAELRNHYLNPALNPNFDVSVFHLIIRYVVYLFFAIMFYSIYRFVIPVFKEPVLKSIFEIVLSIAVVLICSSELINILQLTGSNEVYRHGLSILWGVFSFLLVGYGIWKKKMHLRVTAIALFGITLLKLFFYDLSNLSTVQKTIVFIFVGALLLIVSFLYNKFKNIIFEETNI